MRVAGHALLLVVLGGPASAGAQSFGVRAIGAGAWTATATTTTERRLQGTAFGIEGAAQLGFASLTVRYLEGSVKNDSAGIDREFGEGELFLWARPVRWAAVGVGPHIRSFVATGSTERWLFWELRGRGTAVLLPGQADAYLEGWLTLAGSVDVPEPFNSGRGVEGGLGIALGRLPVALRLRYRVERIGLGDGARRETTEFLMFGVGIGRI